MPRDKQGWRVAPAPDGRGSARAAQAHAAAPAARVLDLRDRAAGDQLALGAAVPARHRAAGAGPVQPVLPAIRSRRGQGQVDHHHRQHGGRDVHGQDQVPGRRQERDPDDAVRDRGPDVLEPRRARRLLAAARRHRSTPSPRRSTRRCWPRSCSASARRCCWSGCSCCWPAARRPAPAAWAGWATSGARQARRVDPEKIRVTFDDVAGIDEAKAELTEIVDFLKTPDRYQKLGGRMPHGVLLFGSARHRQDAAGARGGGRGARGVLLDRRVGVHRGDRRRRRRPRARPVRQGQGGRARRSSSSTSSTRSAVRARDRPGSPAPTMSASRRWIRS